MSARERGTRTAKETRSEQDMEEKELSYLGKNQVWQKTLVWEIKQR